MDATVFENEGALGVGLIARNHDGYLLWARTKLYTVHRGDEPDFSWVKKLWAG